MIVYYLAISSPFFKSKKLFFACKCSLDRFVEKEKDQLIFQDEEAKTEWEKLDKESQERKRINAFLAIAINTRKVKRYKRMFPAKLYREKLCA